MEGRPYFQGSVGSDTIPVGGVLRQKPMKILRWCRIDRQGCIQCRGRDFRFRPVLDDHLADTWELTPKLRAMFDQREGHSCGNCGMSKRVRMVLWSIKRLFPDIRPARVLHLNQVNGLSGFLRGSGHLVETFYDSSQPIAIQREGLINQDMQQLGLGGEQFDLVVHSETLEHLHQYDQALAECHRVLKPGGAQIYTVPLIRNRRTRRRVQLDATGSHLNSLPPSYHGIGKDYQVVWEFGGDFLQSRAAFISELHYDNYWLNPTVFSVVEKKPPATSQS
jgi:SAM-dependent methyltransferase